MLQPETNLPPTNTSGANALETTKPFNRLHPANAGPPSTVVFKKPPSKILIVILSLLITTTIAFAFWWFFLKPAPTGSAQLANDLPSITTPASQPVSIPQEILDHLYGFPSGGPSDTDIFDQFNIKWVRPHPGPFQWGLMQSKPDQPIDFSITDQFVLGYAKANLGTLITLWPYADWDQLNHPTSKNCPVDDIFSQPGSKKVLGDQDFKPGSFKDGKDPGIDYQKEPPDQPKKDWLKFGSEKDKPSDDFGQFLVNSRCNPYDWNAYLTWVKALVERYDGDGVNDLPGLTIPIKYYEILNEPDLNADHLDFYQGTSADYAKLLIKTSEAIKQTDSEAQVLIAGAAGGNDYFLNFYRGVLKDQNTHQAFDIANVHCISNDHYQSFNVKPYQAMLAEFNLDKPIWVTEAEALVSDDLHINASQTYASTKEALKLGATKFFFTGMMFNRDPSKPGLPESHLKLEDYNPQLNGSNPISVFKSITSLP